MPFDVGYILGHQDQYEELRYSLRSLRNFLPGVRNVWVAGAPPPDWSQGIRHIPVDQLPLAEPRDENWWHYRKLNMRTNLLHICNHPEVSEQFLYMNDDFMLVKPTDGTPTPHRGPIADFFPNGSGVLDRRYHNGHYPDTYRLLVDLGVPNPVYVSEHVPLVVEKGRLAEMMISAWHISGFPPASLWGNLADIELVDGGQINGDRLLVREVFKDDWPDDWWSVSTVHRSFFNWPVGERIRELFPEPSRYERIVP